MLKSNWSVGSCQEFGRAHVIRQRLGRAAPSRSLKPHVCLSDERRAAVVRAMLLNQESR